MTAHRLPLACLVVALAAALSSGASAQSDPAPPAPLIDEPQQPADNPLAAGRKLMASGDFAGAVAEFTNVIQQNPKLGAAYLQRGLAYLRLNDPDRARADFDAALQRSPKLTGALDARGKLRAGSGDVAGGLDDLAKAIEINPKFNRALVDRGRLLASGGDTDAAVRDFEAAVANNPDDVDANLQLAYAFHFKGQFKRAHDVLDAAVQRKPDDPALLAARCRMNGDMNRLPDAMADCNRAIEIDPKRVLAFVYRADVRVRANDIAGARDDIAKAFELNPNNAAAFQVRGVIDMHDGDFEKAVADLDQSTRLAPGSARARQSWGYALFQTGDLKGSAQQYGIAAALQSVAPMPHVSYARALTLVGDFDRAIAEANAALKFRNNLPAALVARAAAFEGKGDLQAALADFEAVLKGAPTNSLAQAGRDRVKTKMAGADTGPATGRVALVVGDSAYLRVGELPNPKRDATAVADRLRELGFSSVDLLIDASRQKFSDALADFGRKAAHAEWAVIYFAGHGIEADGVNYLVPVDAQLFAVEDTPNQTIALDQALNAVASAKKLRLVILDACRDNPFEDSFQSSGTGARGLARIEPDTGTLVAFATKHGHVASDGDATNSPFAQALVKRIGTPGLEINKLFRQVHDDVAAATKGQQEPFTYGQLSAEDFFFKPQ